MEISPIQAHSRWQLWYLFDQLLTYKWQAQSEILKVTFQMLFVVTNEPHSLTYEAYEVNERHC